MLGLIGKKIGMTRWFLETGKAVAVTVIQVEPNYITQIKTPKNEGYFSLQVSTGKRRLSRVTKALKGHFSKAKVKPGEKSLEFRVSDEAQKDLPVGSELKLDIFQAGQFVDISTEKSKGKGFQGVIKRHKFNSQDASHGNSISHRAPGSTGQRQTPGRVFKNKRMAGHMGAVHRTVQNQKILQIDLEKNLLLVIGGVPGSKGCYVTIKPAIKKMRKQ